MQTSSTVSKRTSTTIGLCPYTNPAFGDLIILTADKGRFFVYRAIIANVSPVFADMFSLPLCSSDGEKPVVNVTESETVWLLLLRFCYLRTSEPILSLDTILELLEAARKYCMGPVKTWMRRTLSRSEYLGAHALRTYAIACAYDLSDVAQLAARGYLSLPADHETVEELGLISALQYTRLLDYRKRCSAAAVSAMTSTFKQGPLPSWVLGYKTMLGGCARCRQGKETVVRVRDDSGKTVGVTIRPAWTKYIEEITEAMKTRPDPGQALRPTFADHAIRELVRCSGQCSRNIFARTKQFAEWVELTLEVAIAKVPLEAV